MVFRRSYHPIRFARCCRLPMKEVGVFANIALYFSGTTRSIGEGGKNWETFWNWKSFLLKANLAKPVYQLLMNCWKSWVSLSINW